MADYTLSVKIGASLSPKALSTLENLKQELKTLKLTSENSIKSLEKTFSQPWRLPKLDLGEMAKDYTTFKTYTSTVHEMIKKFKELKAQGKENTEAFKNLTQALKRFGISTEYVDEEVKRLSYTLRKLKQASKIDLKIQATKERG